jgi:hypothetical protein
MVLRPEEAVADFVRSEMQALYLGRYVTEKQPAAP